MKNQTDNVVETATLYLCAVAIWATIMIVLLEGAL